MHRTEDGGEHEANPGGVHGGAALLARPRPGVRDRGQQGQSVTGASLEVFRQSVTPQRHRPPSISISRRDDVKWEIDDA